MARFFDDLRSPATRVAVPWFVPDHLEKDWVEHAGRVTDLLRSDPPVPVILIDNVAEYYYASDQEYWDLGKDFPNLAPPYQRWWSEHRIPTQIHSKEKGDTSVSHLLGNRGRVGVLVTALDAKTEAKGVIPENAKWILWCEIFIDFGMRDHTSDGPAGPIFLAIDEHGAMLDKPWMQTFTGGDHAEMMKSYMTWLHPMLLAVSFLHCRNVETVENPVPVKLAKRHYERHGVRPVAYKTLVIEPLKKILRTEGRSGEVGLPKAMHICRGHFKDYREGRGLFGKYHQLVWQPSIVRGTKGKSAPAREVEVKL